LPKGGGKGVCSRHSQLHSPKHSGLSTRRAVAMQARVAPSRVGAESED